MLPFLVNIVRALPLICVPALYYRNETTESSIELGVISFIVIHFVLAFIAVIDTGRKHPSWWEKLARQVHPLLLFLQRASIKSNETGGCSRRITLRKIEIRAGIVGCLSGIIYLNRMRWSRCNVQPKFLGSMEWSLW